MLTCYPYSVYDKTVIFDNDVLCISEIDVHIVGIWLYNCCNDNMINTHTHTHIYIYIYIYIYSYTQMGTECLGKGLILS